MLICEGDASQPLAIFKHLPVPCEDNVLDLLRSAAAHRLDQVRLVREDEFGVVDTRKVARAGGLHLFGFGGERKAVNEVVRDVRVPLVGHDETEVAALATAEAVVSVQDKLDEVDGIPVVNARIVEVVVDLPLASATHSPDELDDGVVEINCDVGLGRGGHRHSEALHGIHELLEARGGEPVTLGTVQVNVETLKVHSDVGVDDGSTGCAVQDTGWVGLAHRGRDLDAALELGKLANDLHRVELERDQGQGIASIVGEPEGQGNVEGTGVLGVGHQLGHGEALANHLEETLAGLARKLLPHEEVIVVHGVDDLATDDDANALSHKLANRIDPVAVGQVEASAGVGGLGRGNVIGNTATNIDRVTGALFNAIAAGITGVKVGEGLGAAVDSLG